MLDVVVESVLCLCFYNKNLHYSAVAHRQRVSSTTLYIPFISSFANFEVRHPRCVGSITKESLYIIQAV
jgi:hypothetical protein